MGRAEIVVNRQEKNSQNGAHHGRRERVGLSVKAPDKEGVDNPERGGQKHNLQKGSRFTHFSCPHAAAVENQREHRTGEADHPHGAGDNQSHS